MNNSTLSLEGGQFLHAKIQGELEALISWLYPFATRTLAQFDDISSDDRDEIFNSKIGQLHQGLLNANSPAMFAGFVKTCMRNAAFDFIKMKRKQAAHMLSLDALLETSSKELNAITYVPSESITELMDELAVSMAQLSHQEAKLFELLAAGASSEDMSHELGIDANTLYVRINRLRKKLAKRRAI